MDSFNQTASFFVSGVGPPVWLSVLLNGAKPLTPGLTRLNFAELTFLGYRSLRTRLRLRTGIIHILNQRNVCNNFFCLDSGRTTYALFQ
jgi:hypothetical protein